MARKTMRDYVEARGGLHVLRGRAAADEAEWVNEPHSTLPGVTVPVYRPPVNPPDPLMSRLTIDEHGVLRFRCQCGRTVMLDDMVDLDNDEVPQGLRVAAAVRASVSMRRTQATARRFACDGCWTHWIRSGLITINDFRRGIGVAPHPANSRKPW